MIGSTVAASDDADTVDPGMAGAWRPAEVLVPAERVTAGGRVPVSRDDVLAAWAAGTLEPREGVRIGTSTWTRRDADDAGQLPVDTGSWGAIRFTAERAGDAILEAGTCAGLIVNGALRAGDVYGLGFLEHPFRVRAGENLILVRRGRGAVAPVVRFAPVPVSISTRDRTRPDAVVGTPIDNWAGIVVVNASSRPLDGATARAIAEDGTVAESPLPSIPPHATAKLPFRLRANAPGPDVERIGFELRVIASDGEPVANGRVELRVRPADSWFLRTHISPTDGSVQGYGFRPALPGEDAEAPKGLVVSLHGAGVGLGSQIPNYRPRPWTHVATPTNRRRFGFDWEDWGRLDLLEVMADVESRHAIDPRRVHLTGHSMGGHGTWINGLMDAGRFASIGPSSGWASFWTYGQRTRIADDGGGTGTIRRRANNVSDTLLLLPNASMAGVYILHAEMDESVPVREARAMRRRLAEFHADWAYYERPGARHWWGAPCLDWPPMLEFFRNHERPERRRSVDFTAVDPHLPGVVWPGAQILAQAATREPSRVQAARDSDGLRVTTENALGLRLEMSGLPAPAVEADATAAPVSVDGTTFVVERDAVVRLTRDSVDAAWAPAAVNPGLAKSPRLPSGFRRAFEHRPLLVVGTNGSDEETRWARDAARHHAEVFRYRGNGRLDIVDDRTFLAMDQGPGASRNVVLYGTSNSNLAWHAILSAETPFELTNGRVRVGDVERSGDDHGLLLCFPSSDGNRLVGVIGGTGPAGRRSAAAIRTFVSGAHLPDWTITSPRILETGWLEADELAIGFFDHRWRFDPEQSAESSR